MPDRRSPRCSPPARFLPIVVLLAGAVAATAPHPVGAQGAPALDSLRTRAERTDFVETTSYDEVLQLSRQLAEAAPEIHFTTFGYTTEGRPLPLLVVGAPDARPASVRATGKTRVYLQGNIHAGEVCGKEALLILLRQYAAGEHRSWSDSLVLLVAPVYNADGNERVRLDNRPRQHGPLGGMGQRPNAQGLDLNRDHTKLDSPEARSLARMLTAYDPHVGVDLHTTNGTRHAYHLTYAPPLHPNTPPGIDGFLRDRWLPDATRRMKEDHGWDIYHYGNRYDGPFGRGWYTFDHRPRFGTNYLGLRNRFAILSEAYAYATFEDRVRATLWFTEDLLDFAEENAGRIRALTEAADRAVLMGRELAVRADYRRSEERVPILMGEVEEERHPYTGEVILRRRDVSVPTPMPEMIAFRAAETEMAPDAYYVLPEAEEVIERLEAHGIALVRQDERRELEMERFRLDSTSVAQEPFQGRRERTVHGAWMATQEELPAGTARVTMDQPLGRLVFTLLEPRSDDGFLAWGLLDEAVEQGRYPVLRVPAGG
jgi:hypothetical protein